MLRVWTGPGTDRGRNCFGSRLLLANQSQVDVQTGASGGADSLLKDIMVRAGQLSEELSALAAASDERRNWRDKARRLRAARALTESKAKRNKRLKADRERKAQARANATKKKRKAKQKNDNVQWQKRAALGHLRDHGAVQKRRSELLHPVVLTTCDPAKVSETAAWCCAVDGDSQALRQCLLLDIALGKIPKCDHILAPDVIVQRDFIASMKDGHVIDGRSAKQMARGIMVLHGVAHVDVQERFQQEVVRHQAFADDFITLGSLQIVLIMAMSGSHDEEYGHGSFQGLNRAPATRGPKIAHKLQVGKGEEILDLIIRLANDPNEDYGSAARQVHNLGIGHGIDYLAPRLVRSVRSCHESKPLPALSEDARKVVTSMQGAKAWFNQAGVSYSEGSGGASLLNMSMAVRAAMEGTCQLLGPVAPSIWRSQLQKQRGINEEGMACCACEHACFLVAEHKRLHGEQSDVPSLGRLARNRLASGVYPKTAAGVMQQFQAETQDPMWLRRDGHELAAYELRQHVPYRPKKKRMTFVVLRGPVKTHAKTLMKLWLSRFKVGDAQGNKKRWQQLEALASKCWAAR